MTLALLALLVDARAANPGFLPTAPPVHVHTSDEERAYWGLGYLRFAVGLPYEIEPAWTLGGEDATIPVGDVVYTANGAGFGWGALAPRRSVEHGLVAGTLHGDLDADVFYWDGVSFGTDFGRAGGFVAYRYSTARRIGGERDEDGEAGARSGPFVDWGMSQLFGLYRFRGNTRAESELVDGYRYLTDFDEGTTGLAWRPVLTVQPTIPVGRFTFIPFAGGSAFVYLASSAWTVNQWEDVLYGPDCLDGCPDSKVTANLLPDGFAGFDMDIRLFGEDRLSLSSLFRPPSSAQDSPVSEIFVVYGRGR